VSSKLDALTPFFTRFLLESLYDVFQQPLAYPFPFGSANLNWLYEVSDARLRRLPYPRLRDQAVSVDEVFAYFKGRYCALWDVAQAQGMTPYLDEEITHVAQALRRIQVQQRRLPALLQEAPQPRQVARN
jgi:hypothetical protein